MTFEELKIKAESGNAEAQVEVGFCYFWGQKVECINYEEAVKWFQKSAEQNCAYGQYWMQRCINEGLGIEFNQSLRNLYARKAFHWFNSIADQNNAKVQLYLGYCHQEGAGTTCNPKLAFEWYKKAAEQGLADAEYCLAICYLSGFGTFQSNKAFIKWTYKAAEHGNAPSQYNWALSLIHGDQTEGIPDYEEAVIWLEKAAEQGHIGAQLELAACYENGYGVEKSNKKATYWYQNAATRGSLEAEGKIYSAEELFNKYTKLINSNNEEDHEKAYIYCLAAYIKGKRDVAYDLAMMYIKGTALVSDGIFADRLLIEAHNNGNEKAKKAHDDLMKTISTYASKAKTNPILPSNKIPIINGIEESLIQFDSIDFKRVQGALCGRNGSVPNYPLIEIKKSNEFQSVNGETLDKSVSDGICLHLTFLQVAKGINYSNLEEAFYFQIFKQLDIFNEFTCFLSTNVKNSESVIANIWEFVVDCGHDIDKAKRIANSLIYHLYGYKNNSFIYPNIYLELVGGNFISVSPDEIKPNYLGATLFRFERFGWIDKVLLAICIVYPFVVSHNDIWNAIKYAGCLTLIYLLFITPIISKIKSIFKRPKYPKRNYIRFFRNPNLSY